MSNYTFSTLNDKEFEEISKDLINAKFSLGLQSFRTGRDGGIDIRHSSPENNNSIVVQVKHYINSGYSLLKHKITNEELTKIVNLKPDRYILVTSIDLTASQKDELKKILSPHVISSNDIIGQKDLNDYLNEFSHIEKQYYKLWFSSINILQSVLDNAIEGRTRYFLSQLENKIKYYVVTKKIDEANSILKSEKILLITGQPGIGKTSLAEIILFQRAKVGFKIYNVENLTEAEDVISVNNSESQIFYFDDFLGANYSEIINSHKTETQLTNFVERIKNTPNKYIILTTRTVILNYATEKYEKISHSSLNNRKFELKLNDYSRYEKALILYNHFYHKGVDERFYDVLLKDKFYHEIIKHPNYTPRIIEFITDKSKIRNFNSDEYHQFIINNLNNPKEIWRYSFANQIDYPDRCLLFTLFSFGNEIEESKLYSAFMARLEYEKTQHNQIIKSNQFELSINILLNGFISSVLYNFNNSSTRKYKFLNPSLADFLINYIGDSFAERKSIISSIFDLDQLRRFKPIDYLIPLEKDLQIIIRDKISNGELNSLKQSDNNINSEVISTLVDYCKDVNIDKLVNQYLKKIDWSVDWNYSVFVRIHRALENLEDSPLSFEYIKDNFIEIIEKLMSCIDDTLYSEDIPELFEKFEINFEDYTNTENGKIIIEQLVERIIVKTEEEYKDSIKDEALDISDIEKVYDDLNQIKEDLFDIFTVNEDIKVQLNFDLDKTYWEDIIEENVMRKEKRDFEQYEYYESMKDEKPIVESEESRIEKLFE